MTSNPSSEPAVRIAVLLTCFNRKTQTLECLARLDAQKIPAHVSLHVYLVDDGSTDGTAGAVRTKHPGVHIIDGDGSLFWCRGMDRAFRAANDIQPPFDFYLMLNDDTVIDENAVSVLLDLQADHPGRSISVGLIRDPKTDRIGYGVFGRSSRLNPLKVELLQSGDGREAVAMNGNCVLIPRTVTAEFGLVDPTFHHRFGDMDLAQRARSGGVSLRPTARPVGHCPANPHSDVMAHARSMSFQSWIEHLNSPKGINPTEWATYARRHGGPFWWFFCVRGYVHAVARWPLARLSPSER